MTSTEASSDAAANATPTQKAIVAPRLDHRDPLLGWLVDGPGLSAGTVCGRATPKERLSMGSSSKRQTTMAKLARERALQERRQQKQEKKDARKQAAAAAKAAESAAPEDVVEDETPAV
jgi:hypothetical protein